MGGAIGVFFVTNVLVLLGLVRTALDWFFNDLLGADLSTDLLSLVEALVSPTVAFFNALDLVLPDQVAQTPPDAPWYLDGEVMIVVMLAWLVAPLVVGLVTFERADLG